MPRNDNEKWQMDLEEYIRQGEPEQSEKPTAWKTAIGLQDVDGLKTSEYLLETAKEHIEGRIDISLCHFTWCRDITKSGPPCPCTQTANATSGQ